MFENLSILSWNFKGLKSKLRCVQYIVRKNKSTITILCEIRAKANNINRMMEVGWGRSKWSSNHDTHPGGRIVILWDPF